MPCMILSILFLRSSNHTKRDKRKGQILKAILQTKMADIVKSKYYLQFYQ